MIKNKTLTIGILQCFILFNSLKAYNIEIKQPLLKNSFGKILLLNLYIKKISPTFVS